MTVADSAPLPVEVVTLGEAMVLMLAADACPLSTAHTFTRAVAGAESNVAIGLSRLGHPTALYGCVGADVHGEVVLRALRADGVDVRRMRRVAGRPTGLLVRDAPYGRPVTVMYHRENSAGSQLCPSDVDTDELRAAKLLHITGITAALSDSALATVTSAAEVARAAGVTVVLDPNLRLRLASRDRWRELIDQLARLADVVLVGADEVELLTGNRDNVGWFFARGARRVVVKDGAAGAMETDGVASYRVPARTVTAVDPVGAGDAFAAGWISGWLRGLAPADRLAWAATVASCVVAARSDTDGLPDASSVHGLVDGAKDVDR